MQIGNRPELMHQRQNTFCGYWQKERVNYEM